MIRECGVGVQAEERTGLVCHLEGRLRGVVVIPLRVGMVGWGYGVMPLCGGEGEDVWRYCKMSERGSGIEI